MLGIAVMVQGFALLLPVLETDPALDGDRPELRRMISWVQPRLDTGDVAVVDSYGTGLWGFLMNNWASTTPWYSLPFEVPVAAISSGAETTLASLPTVSLLTGLCEEYQRIWYISLSEVPDDGLEKVINRLSDCFAQADEKSFSGQTTSRIHVLATTQNPPRQSVPGIQRRRIRQSTAR